MKASVQNVGPNWQEQDTKEIPNNLRCQTTICTLLMWHLTTVSTIFVSEKKMLEGIGSSSKWQGGRVFMGEEDICEKKRKPWEEKGIFLFSPFQAVHLHHQQRYRYFCWTCGLQIPILLWIAIATMVLGQEPLSSKWKKLFVLSPKLFSAHKVRPICSKVSQKWKITKTSAIIQMIKMV